MSLTILDSCDVLDKAEFVVSIASLVVALTTLAVSVLAVFITKNIAKQQVRREEYNYLLFSIVTPYNQIEADVMLLADGSIDTDFTKASLDKEVFLLISKAKNYALMTRNAPLFDYLDRIIIGKTKHNIGLLIEEYFSKREELLEKYGYKKGSGIVRNVSIKTDGKELRNLFLARTRKLRDATIEKINSFLR